MLILFGFSALVVMVSSFTVDVMNERRDAAIRRCMEIIEE